MAVKRRRGRFITFEGLDGSGKSTQMKRLAAALRARGFDVVLTREPGGTAIGGRIREILLDSKTSGLAPTAEMALMFADRAQDLKQLILPAVAAGKIVLCDRYTDSSEAYQGFGRELGSKTILKMHALVCADVWPDLTILLETDESVSVERARSRNTRTIKTSGKDESRFEAENAAFFARVAEGFRAIAERDRNRVAVVRATDSKEKVHRAVMRAVDQRLPELAKRR